MINRQNLNRFKAIHILCNIMVNAQELVEDLEAVEEMGLVRHDLKQNVKRTKELCEKSVNNVFGVGLKEFRLAQRSGASEEEIEKLKEKAQLTNHEMLILYDNQLQARKQFLQLSFHERAHPIEALKSLPIDKTLEVERGLQPEKGRAKG